MISSNSSIENLVTFVIVFVAGALWAKSFSICKARERGPMLCQAEARGLNSDRCASATHKGGLAS